MLQLFTLPELASYLPDTASDPGRAQLISTLVHGLVFETVPEGVAGASVRAKAVALEVAARAFRNSDGYSLERVDDYTYQRPSATQASGVYLTAEERAVLLGLAGVSGGGRVRSVRMRSASQREPWL